MNSVTEEEEEEQREEAKLGGLGNEDSDVGAADDDGEAAARPELDGE